MENPYILSRQPEIESIDKMLFDLFKLFDCEYYRKNKHIFYGFYNQNYTQLAFQYLSEQCKASTNEMELYSEDDINNGDFRNYFPVFREIKRLIDNDNKLQINIEHFLKYKITEYEIEEESRKKIFQITEEKFPEIYKDYESSLKWHKDNGKSDIEISKHYKNCFTASFADMLENGIEPELKRIVKKANSRNRKSKLADKEEFIKFFEKYKPEIAQGLTHKDIITDYEEKNGCTGYINNKFYKQHKDKALSISPNLTTLQKLFNYLIQHTEDIHKLF